MYTIELNIDDGIFDKFMGLLSILPKDKLEVTSSEEYPNISIGESKEEVDDISSIEAKINQLLQEHNLLHFKFYKNPNRILYIYECGTPTHVEDFSRLITVLKDNNIEHNDVGVDAIMIEED